MPLTLLQKVHGPFAEPSQLPGNPRYFVTCGVVDRIRLVKQSSDQEWLGAVLLQCENKTVRVAAARRLNKLNAQKATEGTKS